MSEDLSIIERFRESHHAVARMLAIGMTLSMVRQRTGRSTRSLSLLLADPTFQELIAIYAQKVGEKWDQATDQYLDLGISNMIRAESLIADRLEEDDVPITVLDRISQGRADRFGYNKNSTLRVEHDFASALDKAISRSSKVIEHQPPQGEEQVDQRPLALERPRAKAAQLSSSASPSFSRVLESGVKRRRVA